jgi:dihydroorotate dehydrogenase (NAD+) catalytic subunit
MEVLDGIKLFLTHQGIDRLQDFIGSLDTTCVFPFAEEACPLV